MLDPSRIAGQWATGAEASSQYGDDGYSAAQTTGEPDTPVAGDYNTAWAPKEKNAGEETLELTFEHSVIPAAVNIHETDNPGAVISVAVFDPEDEEWVTVWEGDSEEVNESMRVFSPELDDVDFATNAVLLTLDTDLVEGWNEIDAVQLEGRP